MGSALTRSIRARLQFQIKRQTTHSTWKLVKVDKHVVAHLQTDTVKCLVKHSVVERLAARPSMADATLGQI